MKTVRVEPEAKQELAAAAAWYEQRREGLGLELVAEVDAVFAAITGNPSRYPPYPRVAPELGVRRAAARRFPYRSRSSNSRTSFVFSRWLTRSGDPVTGADD